MFKIIRLFICFYYLSLGAYGRKAPFITPCTWNDEKCILSSSQHAIPIMTAGVPELGIPTTDPFVLKDVKLEEDGLKLSFQGLKVIGASKCQMQSISRDKEASSISMVIDCPIEAVGDYTVEGKLLFVPIAGSGPFNIKCNKLRVSSKIYIEEVDGSDGKKHWKIKKIDHTYDPLEKFYMNFENLFNGDKKKAEPILKILDSNWRDLILGIGKPLVDEVVEELTSVIGKLYEAVPSEELQIV